MGRLGLIAGLAAAWMAGAAAPPPFAPVAQVLAALDQGDPQLARSLSDAALNQDMPGAHDRACLLLYRGLADALLGDRAPAERDLSAAIDSHALLPDEEGQAYLQRGFLREGAGQPDEAIADYGAAISLKGYSTATAYNKRGDAYFRQGRVMDAQQDYLAALAADGGQSHQAYYGLGRIAESQGEKLRARDFYAKAVAIDGAYAAAAERLSALDDPAVPTQRVVLRPPPVPGNDDPPGLPAVPPLAPLEPISTLALRPALDKPDHRLWPGDEVQLGAWRSEEEARAGWARIKALAAGALDNSTPQIVSAYIPHKGHYFRLRVISSPGESGDNLCARLSAKSLACFAVRG